MHFGRRRESPPPPQTGARKERSIYLSSDLPSLSSLPYFTICLFKKVSGRRLSEVVSEENRGLKELLAALSDPQTSASSPLIRVDLDEFQKTWGDKVRTLNERLVKINGQLDCLSNS